MKQKYKNRIFLPSAAILLLIGNLAIAQTGGSGGGGTGDTGTDTGTGGTGSGSGTGSGGTGSGIGNGNDDNRNQPNDSGLPEVPDSRCGDSTAQNDSTAVDRTGCPETQ